MSEFGHPRVSAIITTYNYAEYIADAIESVLGQTIQPDEIVVVDDGSTDDTTAIVARYASRGVRYIRQTNAGAGAARNRGIQETTGELVAFLDADDLWMPAKLHDQLAFLGRSPETILVSGQMLWWHVRKDERHVERFGIAPGRDLRREIAVRNVVGNPSMTLIRRAALNAAGPFDATLRWGQDWELFIRLARIGPFGWLPDPVITYRWHGASLSHDNRWERLTVLERIARRAVASHTPAWQRPLLWERVWSARELERARLEFSSGGSRLAQLQHATAALLIWPVDDARDKVEFTLRSLIGERAYQRLRQIRRRI